MSPEDVGFHLEPVRELALGVSRTLRHDVTLRSIRGTTGRPFEFSNGLLADNNKPARRKADESLSASDGIRSGAL
jgi:hypothetical protein